MTASRHELHIVAVHGFFYRFPDHRLHRPVDVHLQHKGLYRQLHPLHPFLAHQKIHDPRSVPGRVECRKPLFFKVQIAAKLHIRRLFSLHSISGKCLSHILSAFLCFDSREQIIVEHDCTRSCLHTVNIQTQIFLFIKHFQFFQIGITDLFCHKFIKFWSGFFSIFRILLRDLIPFQRLSSKIQDFFIQL